MKTWFYRTIVELLHQFRWSFMPPLMVYLAAGISGLTAIVGTFFVKDYLGLSAAFLASLSFWAGIPWVLKMPLGHLVDLIWRWKYLLVYCGAMLITFSILIMYGLIAHTDMLTPYMSIEAWYVTAALLAPVGYVVQDVVADAMTVEAVPSVDNKGRKFSDKVSRSMHTTMQTLGRFAIISGFILVAGINIVLFSNVEMMTQDEKTATYAIIYLSALFIPLISVVGVIMGQIILHRRARSLREQGVSENVISAAFFQPEEKTKPNVWIFAGSGIFVVFTLGMGLSDFPFAQEIIFIGSMLIILFLIFRLIKHLEHHHAHALVGTAIIIFIFRAMPLPGAGATWFEIDVLGFDQQFLSILSLISSLLALLGMILLRPLMASKSIAYIVVLLTVAAGLLSLPNIGLYYGLHHWTGELTGGIVDAHFIAIIDTAMESPLGQIAMIPMLAWIARNAPANLKATFFAVMASFTNLALSASSLATKYLNQFFTVTREIKDKVTGNIISAADYTELGLLLMVVSLIIVTLPLASIYIIQHSKFKTTQ